MSDGPQGSRWEPIGLRELLAEAGLDGVPAEGGMPAEGGRPTHSLSEKRASESSRRLKPAARGGTALGTEAGRGNAIEWPAVRVTAVCDDSRDAVPGCCFVAVRGERFDGHAFVDAAARAGAAVVVVQDDQRDRPGSATGTAGAIAAAGAIGNPGGPGTGGGGPVWIRVDDTRAALSQLAGSFFRLQAGGGSGLKLIGITGTNGKSTVGWMLRSILNRAGGRCAVIGTIEYDLIGSRFAAPLTTPGAVALCAHLAAAERAGADWAVMEVSSHALEQRRCDGQRFAAAVFTNLSQDHLDYHGGMEAYFRAKRRLFDLLGADGVAVVNGDDPRGQALLRELPARGVSFGLERPGADVSAAVRSMTRSGTEMVIRGRRFERAVRLALIGRHNVMNALAAAATAEALGVGADDIAGGLESLGGVRGRLERVEPAGWPFTVVVDYAHTDAALENVLDALRPLTAGRLICVFGCGGDRDRGKRPRMAAAVARGADRAIVTSDNPRGEDPGKIIKEILPGFPAEGGCAVAVEADRRRAIETAIREARRGDCVLIAGKGHEDYQIVGERRLRFDDAEVARRCLGQMSIGEQVA